MAEERTLRRLAAVLCADMVGYSRHMSADEQGTLARLKEVRRDLLDRKIEEHRGRVAKTMGDGFLAEFASVVDALRCAVEMQQEMTARNAGVEPGRRIEFRIGINVGDIVVEAGDIFGDGVNVAARLEPLAEPGGICVSARVQEDARGKLDLAFDDIGEQQLRNIPWPVRAYRARPRARVTAEPALAQPEEPSLAVLPFANMSGDPEQAYFAEGIAEDLITDLSKMAGLLVIARNSSFAYKGRSVDVRTIARELGVRYVVEGSVRRASERLRINAELIDAVSGRHLWAERYDRDMADVFMVQDEVVGEIIRALLGRLPSARRRSRCRTTSFDAYDLFVRGRMLAIGSPEETRAARLLLRKAIQLDPEFAEAHAWLALSYHNGAMYCGEPVEENLELARSAASQAVSLDPENVDGQITLGYLRAFDGELTEGAAQIETALGVDPNQARGWSMLGDLKVFQGRPDQAIDCARKSIRLDPHPPGICYWLLGFAEYAAGRYEDAVGTLRHESARGPGVRRLLAAALAQHGRMPEAREEARRFLADFPRFSARQWGSTQPFRNDADRQHFIEGYVKAGLPE
jgi:adenylate cyclase